MAMVSAGMSVAMVSAGVGVAMVSAGVGVAENEDVREEFQSTYTV